VLFKYFIEFDEDGEIKNFFKSERECKGCKEYIVKLISINRKIEKIEKFDNELEKATEKILKNMKKFDTELNKTIRDLRRL